MKKLITILPLFLLQAMLPTQAQTKADYSEAKRFLVSNMWDAVGSREVKPVFIGNTDNFWYKYSTTRGTRYYLVNPKRGTRKPLFDNGEMAVAIGNITHKTYTDSTLNIHPRFADDGKTFLLDIDGKRIRYDLATRKCQEVPLPKREPFKVPERKEHMSKYSADSLFRVYCIGHDIWMERVGEKPLRVTDDGCDRFSYSDDDFNKDSALFTAKAQWIGKTHCLYVLREDHRNMQSLPVVSTTAGRPRLVTPITGGNQYAMPGDKYVTQYELSLIDARQGTARKVALKKWKDQTVKVLHVSSDGRYIYVLRMRRTCDELDVCKVDVASATVSVILNEECKPYFSDRLLSMTFLNGDSEFIWWSERSGWGHFYLYDSEGNYKGAITSGEWMAERIVRIDERKRQLYFIGHGREKDFNPYYAQLMKVSLKGGKTVTLTPEEAQHDIVLSPSGGFFIDNFSRVDLVPTSVLRDSNGRLVCRLEEADLSKLYAMGWQMPERFKVKAADGKTDLYGVMWKPFRFDATRRYPIISYVYPGPQQEAVPLSFTTTGDHNAALAQVGFVVVGMGHRGGSPLRDKAYRTYGYGNLRDYPLADDKHALEQLGTTHPYIDLSRVGIFGHSGGGFMAATALMTYPDFYKAAVASSGNHDNNIFHKEWGETFHGVQQKVVGNDTVFTCRIPTNLELAKNLRGHLLLVTGEEDTNVHPGNTYKLANALIKANKNFDMLVLPGQNHLYKGEASDFWRKKIWFHFAKHLLGDFSAETTADMN